MSALTQPLSSYAPNAVSRPIVGYDARFSLGEYRGMGRYLRRLIQAIPGNAIGFCASGEKDDSLALRANGFQFHPMWEQASLPRRVAESGIQFFLAPYNTAPLRLPANTQLILVVHDLIYMRTTAELPLSRSTYQNVGRLYRRWIVPRAVSRADHILCVSQFTRHELLRRFAVDAGRVTVIPNTVDASWYELQASPSNHLLCVSGEAPNKNLEVAINGFAEFCRNSEVRSTQLKIVGVRAAYHSHFRSFAERHGVAKRVEFLPFLSDLALQSLYASARAFIFPSREEGFGVPVLEALAAGTPVIAANSSSVPEVAGSAALYFHPDAPRELASQLGTLLSDAQLQRTMSHRGRRQAGLFHPAAVDARISEFWERLLRP